MIQDNSQRPQELDPRRGEELLGQLTPEVLDVLQHLGHVVWMVQMLEGTVATYLVLVHRLEPGGARARAESAFEKASKQTLGGLLRAIRGPDTPPNLVERLESFVEDRNWVTHNIFREYWGTARDPDVAISLMLRLDAIADEALQIAKVFGDEIEAYVLANGVTRQRFDQITREITADVRAGRSETGRFGFAE